MTFRTSHLLAAFPLGILSALAFEPVGLWPLMPLAFAALAMLVSRCGSMGKALLTGWLFGAGQFVLGLNWIATAFTYQAAMPGWLGWVAVVLLSLYLAVYPALATGLAWRFGQRSPIALVLALAGGWALAEWLRATMFTGFAWNPVGVTLLDTFWLGSATVIGTYGLSMLVVLLGGAIFLVFAKARRSAAILATLLLGLGLLAFATRTAPQVAAGKSIRVVQPNIGQEDKWREGLEEEAFRRLTSLSVLKPGARPTLLLWPEVAVPVAFQIEGPPPPRRTAGLPPARRAGQVLRPSSDLLVTGAFSLVVDGQANLVGSTNSVMPITADGRILGRYDKAHLVPYGEYLPMRPLLSAIGLSQLAPGVGDTLSGPGPRNLALPGWGTMGLQICYEIIFSGQVVDPNNRPDFLFNPSNDAWFGSWGPPQHLAQARLRAAEEGLPVIRSTPTGISAVIDANGAVSASLPWRTAGAIDAELPLAKPPTLFSRIGNPLPLGLAFLLLLLAVGMDARGRYRQHI
ncbi:apolipoprotein N-acyltransferase [Sphingomonas glaciei]|uniref:Apolipoprotein N-acyltransferase n=1 Tax=Sphingomonas glaciei TaxID=2938948 RepID=A0ABY5MW36_9SPHN|nr:apolipoprotein N-acyltransferase [Sphingomonas glaciei]UUR08196.1 apolipoprotein N-acyltransferase [Sphingomonas glaciei]